MGRITNSADRSDSTQPSLTNYLPGGPSTSTRTSRVERFVKSLLRPRGGLRVVVRRKGR